RRAPAGGALEPRVRREAGPGHRLRQAGPLRIVPTADRDPSAVAARITAVWDGDEVAVAIAPRRPAVARMVEQRRRDELQAGLVLREVDEHARAGAPLAIQRGQHGG